MNWKIRRESNLFATLVKIDWCRHEMRTFHCVHWLTLRIDDDIHWWWTWLETELYDELKLNERNRAYQQWDDYIDCVRFSWLHDLENRFNAYKFHNQFVHAKHFRHIMKLNVAEQVLDSITDVKWWCFCLRSLPEWLIE